MTVNARCYFGSLLICVIEQSIKKVFVGINKIILKLNNEHCLMLVQHTEESLEPATLFSFYLLSFSMSSILQALNSSLFCLSSPSLPFLSIYATRCRKKKKKKSLSVCLNVYSVILFSC